MLALTWTRAVLTQSQPDGSIARYEGRGSGGQRSSRLPTQGRSSSRVIHGRKHGKNTAGQPYHTVQFQSVHLRLHIPFGARSRPACQKTWPDIAKGCALWQLPWAELK
jgi:hypothetical protein